MSKNGVSASLPSGAAIPSVEATYPDTWRKRRWRRLGAFRLALIGVVLFAVGAIGSRRGAPWAATALGFVFPTLMVANLVWLWSLFFKCPRCGGSFVRGHRTTTAGKSRSLFDPYTRRCLNCGLPLRSR